MSRDGWESGSLTLSTRAYVKFKSDLLEAYNARVEQAYQGLLKMHAAIAAQAKGTRGFDFAAAVDAYFDRAAKSLSIDLFDEYDVREFLLTKPTAEQPRRKLKSPLKKEMPFAKRDTRQYANTYCSVTLNAADRTVGWRVAENNHAVENAHATWLGKQVFRMLGQVEWTRGTGGALYGNDEYNRDDREDGGGNYITQAFGPLGDKAREAAYGVRRPRRAMRHSR